MNAKPDTAAALKGRCVLIVEDELLLAMELQKTLEDEGCIVLGPLKNVEQALAVLEQKLPDAAILDLNLDGDRSTPVAAALRTEGIPFIVTTGYAEKVAADAVFQDMPWVNKPIHRKELVRLLERILKS